MPMKDPTENSSGFSRPSEIVPNAMFIGTFVQVESRDYSGPPRFNKDGTQQQRQSIVWHFTLRDHSTLQPVLNDGQPYEMWRFTSDATGTGSQARDILQAMAGREVSNAEVKQLLDSDPEHMPTKLYGRSVLLIMTQYTDRNGNQQVGIGQILPLSQSDRARLQAAATRPVAPVAAVADESPMMGRPAVQFNQNGQQVQPPPAPVAVGATADGSAELPW